MLITTAGTEQNGNSTMQTHLSFVQLITSVVGLSVGIGMATATAIIVVAALFQ